MKRCPACGERYEDVYTTCGDGTPLEVDSDNSPLPVRPTSSNEFKRSPARPEAKKAPAPMAKKIAPKQKPTPIMPRAPGGSRGLMRLVFYGTLMVAASYLVHRGIIEARRRQAAMQALVATKTAQDTIKADAIRILESTNAEMAISAQGNLVSDLEKAAARAPNTTKPMLEALARWSRSMASTDVQLVQAQQAFNKGADLENVRTLGAFQIKRGFLNKACDIWDREANLELHTEDDLRREMASNRVPPESISRFFANNYILIAFKAIQQHGLALQNYSQNIRALNGVIAANFDKPSTPQAVTNLQQALESCKSAAHDLNDAFTDSIAAVK